MDTKKVPAPKPRKVWHRKPAERAHSTKQGVQGYDRRQSHENIKAELDEMESEDKLRVGVLLSGGGRTLQNFLDHIDQEKLDATIEVVGSSREDAYGLVRASEAGIPTACVPRKQFEKWEDFNGELNQALSPFSLDLIVMAGFMSLFVPGDWFEGSMMNIHPALIPAFCGKSWYGDKVHKAVLEAGVKVTGCTVHFADDEYDQGPIILQAAVPVHDDDTAESLAARVFQQECQLYPKAIQLYAEGRLEVQGRRVIIRNR